MIYPLTAITILSTLSYNLTKRFIPRICDLFFNANLYGYDLCKKEKPKIPEAVGVVSSCFFLVALFLFIPVPFSINQFVVDSRFPHEDFVELIAALLSICCMILLGFTDDVLNLKWRHKLLLPTVATLPLLMVYYVNSNSTTILMPKFIRSLVGVSVDIGVLYYIYMGMLAVFCTNAINILAGINGLEVGQSLVIACSIIIFNLIELSKNNNLKQHQFSLFLMMPYVGTSYALWQYNRYPAKIFVGDTFCYFSGMSFAVVGILGHFSKTLLLFFIPQILNFLYSIPQLFHFVPCPRHRLPKYNPATDLLETSKTIFKKNDLGILGKIFVYIFQFLRIIEWKESKNETIVTNNFTLINFLIVIFGPIHEKLLTHLLLALQVFCTLIAFLIRYPLASFFYNS